MSPLMLFVLAGMGTPGRQGHPELCPSEKL